MAWDELHDADRTWRVRVQLTDHPGQLATLAARLSAKGCNLLGVAVLPVTGAGGTANTGTVVDELVLRAPAAMSASALRGLVATPGGRCVGIVAASVNDLVDAQTAVLRAAASTASGTTTVGAALASVLGAESVSDAADEEPDGRPLRVSSDRHRVTITLEPGRQVIAERAWTPFTDGELARVPALLELLGLLGRPVGPAEPAEPAGPAVSVGPAEPVVERPGGSAAVPQRPRRQLSPLDAQFLNAETPTTRTHVGLVTVLDPSDSAPVTVAGLRTLIGGRLHLVTPLRWRLQPVPLGLDLPYWVDVGRVDLTHHIRETRLPSPGTDEQLAEEVARLTETALDRDRPLWECVLVHGLTGGRQALYTKVHHAVVDGVSGAEVLAVVFDLDAVPRSVPAPSAADRAEPDLGAGEMLARGARRLSGLPLGLARSGPALLPHLLELPGAAGLPGAGRLDAVATRLGRLVRRRPSDAPELAPRVAVAPMTPFNRPLTTRRAFAFTSLPLGDVKAVKNALGLTVNDVVVALCTTALRRWLLEHDALPGAALVASIPVSVRTPEQVGTAGNQISFMLATLPTDVADPAQRLHDLHAALLAAKARFARTPSTLLHGCSAVVPQALHGVATRAVLRAATVGAPPFNLLISNVPGPQVPLYVAGARVTGTFPASVVSDVGGGLNFTVMSYDGHLDFGIVSCRDLVPDVWDIAGYLRDALAELTDLVAAPALATLSVLEA